MNNDNVEILEINISEIDEALANVNLYIDELTLICKNPHTPASNRIAMIEELNTLIGQRVSLEEEKRKNKYQLENIIKGAHIK